MLPKNPEKSARQTLLFPREQGRTETPLESPAMQPHWRNSFKGRFPRFYFPAIAAILGKAISIPCLILENQLYRDPFKNFSANLPCGSASGERTFRESQRDNIQQVILSETDETWGTDQPSSFNLRTYITVSRLFLSSRVSEYKLSTTAHVTSRSCPAPEQNETRELIRTLTSYTFILVAQAPQCAVHQLAKSIFIF